MDEQELTAEQIELHWKWAQAQEMEAKAVKLQCDAYIGYLEELRSWLSAHEYQESPIATEQQVTPILTQESELWALIFKKAKKIIEMI